MYNINRRKFLGYFGCGCCSLILPSCSTVPITERKQLSIIRDKVGEEILNVFIPTTPNPTSGFLLMVPKKELIYLDVTFEQASKFIVSAGTTNIN